MKSSVQTIGKCNIPAVGFGLWKLEKDIAAQSVRHAIEIGYRHLDSAADYANEEQVGDGIRLALENGLCKREDLWVTSKLWNTDHRPEHVAPALNKTLEDLKLDYLDLYLIHFPIALKHVPHDVRYPAEWLYDPDSKEMVLDQVPIHETWGAMEDLVKAGRIKNIGICNFNSGLIHDLLSYARIKPAVLQIESHPYLSQQGLIRLCHDRDIAVTAFSPLGALSYISLDMAGKQDVVLEEQVVKSIAEKVGKTPAQVVLRWAVQRGTSIIPKSSSPDRMRENLALFDFELSDDDMTTINALNQNRRFNDPGVFCEQAFGTYHPIYD